MPKKFTVRIDDKIADEINILAKKTRIPKARLTAQAYELLIEVYNQLKEIYDEEVVNLNLIEVINKSRKKDVRGYKNESS